MNEYDIKDFNIYLTKGSDKLCYLSDKYPGKILKVTSLNRAHQTNREIQYIEFLIRRKNVPSFMPKYYGSCRNNEKIGYVQEYLQGPKIKSFNEILDFYYPTNLEYVEDALISLRKEMLDRNVIILDLHGLNIIGNIETLKLWVIEGYGTTEFIPLPKYFHIFGRFKIERQWRKFLVRYSKYLTALSNKYGCWVPSKLVSSPVDI